MDERMKRIFEPPEKVQKLYEAIAEFVNEKRDLSTLKVSEITSRAGIGKGTAYEYFSSKEEILLYAAMWLCGKQMNQMIEGISARNGFKEKYFYLLEWLQEHRQYNDLLVKTMKGGFQGDCEKIKSCVTEELAVQLRKRMTAQINGLLEMGCQEGIFTEKNVEKRILIFFGSLMQYGFAVINLEDGAGMQMTKTELRELAYECMVKSLN